MRTSLVTLVVCAVAVCGLSGPAFAVPYAILFNGGYSASDNAAAFENDTRLIYDVLTSPVADSSSIMISN